MIFILCSKAHINVSLCFKCSHFFIVVSLELLEDANGIKESQLLPVNRVKRGSDLPYYVTATVTYNRSLPLFTIGSGGDTIDPVTGRYFYNAPLHKEQTYYYFIRVYSAAHTSEVGATCDVNYVNLYFLCSFLSLVPVNYHLQSV